MDHNTCVFIRRQINDTIQEQFTPSFFEFMMQNLLLIIAINYSRTATTSKCNTN